MKLTEHQKLVEIPQAIRQYLDEKNSSQAQLAKMAGVGAAYVTQILQGKTHIGETQIKDKYYIDLCRAIGYNVTVQKWRHFDTANYMLQFTEVENARENKTRLVIDGDTGSGKSYFCKKYKKTKPNNTFIVKCLAVENSKEFAKNIAGVVGVETIGTAGAIIKKIADKLCNLDGDAVLIIDEAEHIGNKSGYINIIKSLSDLLEDKVAFVLVGMDISKILQRGFERKKQNFRQTARRFAKRVLCFSDIREDISNICNELNIKNKHVLNWLTNRIHNFGELEYILLEAMEESEKSGTEISVQMLNELYV